jgi:hypothetical protein
MNTLIVILILAAIYVGYRIHRNEDRAEKAVLAQQEQPVVRHREKPGRIYFLQNPRNPDKIKVVKSTVELATPFKIVDTFSTATPNTTLAKIYRDLVDYHEGSQWYNADAVRMYLDSLRGVA